MGNRTEKVDKEDQSCEAPCSLRTSCKNCTQVLNSFFYYLETILFQENHIDIEFVHRARVCGVQIRIVVLTRMLTFLPFRMACAPSGLRTKTNAAIWISRRLKREVQRANEMYLLGQVCTQR